MPNTPPPQKIVIIGNSGFAREGYAILQYVMQCSPHISFKGFLSFEGFPGNLKKLAHYLLGNDDDYTFAEDEYAFVCIGDPLIRKKAMTKLAARGARFTNIIHPGSYVDPSSVMGVGNYIGYNCIVSSDCVIGNGNVLNSVVNLGHDCVIGDYNFIAPGSQILGNVVMGDCNSIGSTSIVLPKAKVGSHNIIAPMSVIYKGCRSHCYMAGNPAKKIGTTEDIQEEPAE